MNFNLIIGVVGLVLAAIAAFYAYQNYNKYIAVEKLNINPQLTYHSNICADANCSPTFSIQNNGQIQAKQVSVFITPALVAQNRTDGLLLKFAFLPDWNPKIEEIKPGDNINLNLPKGFIDQIVSDAKKFTLSFSSGATYDSSTVTPDRILLEIEVKYVRDSDLKKYDDRLYYVQNATGDQWISIDRATNTKSYKDLVNAIKKTDYMDFSIYTSIGSDAVYHSSHD